MRRLYFILISLMLTMAVMAEGIDRNAALLKAQKFMPGKEFTMGKTPARARAKAPQKSDAFYVFNAKDNGGFVIVSGDDRTEDILCYSERGNLDVDQVPENMKWWLDELARQIEALGTSLEAAPHRAPSAAIAPLIKSKWSQHAPYNYMCPDGNYVDYDESSYNTGNRCVTGCVATAMAQIMYYWKWPKTCPALDAYEVSKGKTLKALPATTFKWDKMKDTYGWNETGTSANAVAELMRYCGQAVHMGYSPSGSGAAVSANIMASIFQYSPNSHDISRNNYSVSRWESIIYDELANQRPVLYDGGSKSSAHQFIVDGYDGAGLFHFNWGWGGSSDCYGVLSLADPYGDGNGYQYGQGAIIGVKPAEDGEVMMPFMYSWIDNRTPVATYNRPASADNFTSVSLNGQVYAQYTLEPTSSLDVEMGWGLFQDDRMLQLLDSKTMTFEASSWWSNEYNATTSFGAGLADGTYELSHVYRFSNDTEWEPCHLDGNKFLAEIKGNTLKVFVPNPDNMSFSVNSLTTSDEPIANETVSVNVNITNTGESREEIVSLWIQKPSDEQWTNISKISCWVDLGKSYDVTTSFIPDVAGVYQLKITAGSSEEALATATIKVATSELVVVDGITYRCVPDYRKAIVINDGKNYHDISGDVTILQKVTASGVDCQVTRIADRAFEDWYQIASVTIPEGVTSIGNNAFAYCNNLNKVVLPSTVTRFGENIFYYCNHLSAVCSYIQNPPAVSDNAFTTRKWNGQTQQYDPTPCPAILYVPVGTKAQYEALAGWKWFAGIEEGELLEATVGGLRYYYSTGNGKATVIKDASYQKLTEVSIPATVGIDGKNYRVTGIGNSAFSGCWQLQSVTLPEGLETIGENAFYNSNSIKTMTIPEGVTTIGNYAFAYMYGLTKLELPSSLKEIGVQVIEGCTELMSVVSRNTNPPAISDNTFATNRWNEQTQQYDLTPSLATLYVPIGTKAQYESLSGWKWFTDIEEGEPQETTIGRLRYSYSTSGEKATVIQDTSYQEFTELSIPATVSIDGKEYRVTGIGNSAFYNCWQLRSLTLPEGLETIGRQAFMYVPVSELTLPTSLKTIREQAFFNCNGIKELIIPEGVASIGDYAFAYMNGLTKLELPATLKEIGRRLIEGCTKLETVVSHITAPQAISNYTFATSTWNDQTQQADMTPSTATLYVPIGTKTQYEALSGWTWFANIVESEQAGTGIATMEHRAATDGRWYNLQGQPIDKPQKGVFIRNGRKVVVK